MSKKICILNGSPRPTGNTKELIKRFTKGAEAAGHEVTCFDLQKMDIHGCLCRKEKTMGFFMKSPVPFYHQQ